MPRFQITGPDGRRYEVTAPDGASEQDVMRYIQSQGRPGDAALPGPPADAMLDPNQPGPSPQTESPITHRAAMLPFIEREDGSMEFAWPQIALDVADSVKQLGRAAESAAGVPHSPAETFPRPQDAILATLPVMGETYPLVGAARAARPAVPPPVPRVSANAQRAAEDLAAFQRQDVPVLAPAFGGVPTRMASKGLSEMFAIGAPLQGAIENTYRGMSAAAGRAADRLAPAATFDQAGATLQRGLDRFRTAGVREIEPGVLAQRGIEPLAPVQPHEVMSQGAAQRATAAAPLRAVNQGGTAQTARGVEVPSARSLEQTILARRAVEDIPDAQLRNLIRSRADETSFAVRSEALYENAHRQLPPQMRINDTANPQLFSAVNTQRAVHALRLEQEASRLPGGVIGGRYAGLAERVQTNVRLPTLRAMRTAVGRDLANFSYAETGLDRTQLNTLYKALSRDQEIAYQDLANRAHINSRLSNNQPNYVSPEVARAADRALYEFRRADRYFRQGIARMDTFLKVVSAENPQMAAARLVKAAMEGAQGDIRLFMNALRALRPEERAQFASLVIREMGKPIPSARGISQDVGFSPQSFATRYQKFDARARQMLFPGAHGRAVDDLMRIANRLANVERFENVSGSGRMAANVSGILGLIGSLATGNVMAPVAMGGGGFLLSALLAHPLYARWLVNYATIKMSMRGARVTTNSAVIGSLRQLASYAATDPALGPVLRAAFLENGIAAESGPDQQEQQRPDFQQPNPY